MAIHTSLATPTANSYVSVASADAYLTAAEEGDSWKKIDNEMTSTTAARIRKENLLIQASREIDHTFRFHSAKYNQGYRGDDQYQALEFPRIENVDVNGNLFLPDEVKYATYEQALWIINRPNLKTEEDGTHVKKKFIGDETENYLKGWINRQVPKWGNFSWDKSRY